MSDGYHISKTGELSYAVPATCGWVRAYHPSGFHVTLPVPFAPGPSSYQAAFAAVSAIIEAGFLVREPGLEAGETRDEVGWVVRMTKEGRQGPAQVLHLYKKIDHWTLPFLTVYLNTADDIRAFNDASGLDVTRLPEYIGEGRLERGKSPKTDALIVPVRRPMSVVHKPNPKYDPAAAEAAKNSKDPYTVAKKVFVRWGEQAAPTSAHAQADHQQADADEPPSVEAIVAGYGRAQTAEVFLNLEELRKEVWYTSTVEQQLAMKTASTAAKVRLKIA